MLENPYLLALNKLKRVSRMKPNRIFLRLAASFFALISAEQLAAQLPAPITLIKADRLLDPRTGNVFSPAAVLIENGKIKEVGPPSQVQADAPAGVKTIDLGSTTLLPGLIDSHTHLLFPAWRNPQIGRCTQLSPMPTFSMAVNGELAFHGGASAAQSIEQLAQTLKQIELHWDDDVRVDPLTRDFAAVATPYHEVLTYSGAQPIDSTGFFIALVENRDGQRQFRNMHWSVPVPAPNPPPSAGARRTSL